MITFFAEEVTFPAVNEDKLVDWINRVAAVYQKSIGGLTYIFCDDNRILEINRQYLQHDYYTDIITFDYTEEDEISGDIFISLDTVQSNSQLYKTQFMDELYRVIIHGVLHLCGLKDESETEQTMMRTAENQALEMLKITG